MEPFLKTTTTNINDKIVKIRIISKNMLNLQNIHYKNRKQDKGLRRFWLDNTKTLSFYYKRYHVEFKLMHTLALACVPLFYLPAIHDFKEG